MASPRTPVEKYRAAQAAGTWQPNPAIGFFPTSIGRLYRLELDKRSEWYQIYFEYDTGGFQVGDLVAYDLTDGNFAQYAVNVRRALAVPSIKHKRVLGFTYQLYDADLAVCTSPSS